MRTSAVSNRVQVFNSATAPYRRPGVDDSAESIVNRTSNRSQFTAELEKYLDDAKKGRPGTYSRVSPELQRRRAESAQFYGDSKPTLLDEYSGYLSGLRGAQKARFINGVNGGTQTLSSLDSINRIAPTAEQIAALYKNS